MNVLLAAGSGWTREIGIRRTVCARAEDIQMQFLVESLTVSGIGAGVGFLVGIMLAYGGTAVFRYFPGSGIYPVVPPATALLAVGSSIAVGAVFGTYPASHGGAAIDCGCRRAGVASCSYLPKFTVLP